MPFVTSSDALVTVFCISLWAKEPSRLGSLWLVWQARLELTALLHFQMVFLSVELVESYWVALDLEYLWVQTKSPNKTGN